MQRSAVTLALLVFWVNLQQQSGVPVAAVLDVRAVVAQLLLAYLAAFWIRLGWHGAAARRSTTVSRAGGAVASHQARSAE